MRALRFHGVGDLRLEEVPRPEPGPGDVLVQVEVALTDGTDLKAFRRGHPVLLGELPSPFGHEFCGIDVASGKRVVAANSAAGDERGEPPELLNGAYAEYLVVPAAIAKVNLLPVPRGLAAEVAAMVEPLACCLRGVERAEIERGDRVTVVGAGPIGLMLCACVADAGGAPEVVGGRPERRELVPLFGGETGEGESADVVIEAAGTEEAWQSAIELVRPGGTVIYLRRTRGKCRVARRRVSPPLRGADAARRLPPRTAARPSRSRFPRERRVSMGSARHAPGRARGRRRAVRRPAARLPEGRRRALNFVFQKHKRRSSHPATAWLSRFGPRREGLCFRNTKSLRASRRASGRARARRAAPRGRPRRSGSRATRRA